MSRAASDQARDGTVGVFTTAKLAKLLATEFRAGLTSRRDLADRLSSPDRKLSVHGIDAWFKRNDSNYGLERASLREDGPSFAIPERRWPALLRIFGLERSFLDMSDAQAAAWLVAESDRREAPSEPSARRIDPSAVAPREFVSERPSVAVMPFTCVGGDEADRRVVADGIAEDIVIQLSRIPELFVVSRASTHRLDPGDWDVGSIRRALGVRFLLEGSVRATAEKLRVTVQLVDALTADVAWSAQFSASNDQDLFEVQDRIAIKICAHLEPKIRLSDINYGSRTGSTEAWRLWQEGWFQLFIDAPAPSPERSLALFRRAHELDPDYALARAGISVALSTGMLWGGLGPEHYEEARAHATAASRMLDENPAVLYAMAIVAFVEPVPLSVPLGFMQRAVDLEPSNAMYRANCGYLKANMGRVDEGLEECLEAMRLAPLDSREPFLCHMLAGAYLNAGQYERVLETLIPCRRYAEVDFIHLQNAFAQHKLGRDDEAIRDLASIPAPRSYAFYEFSVMKKLWHAMPDDEKRAFLALFERAGIR